MVAAAHRRTGQLIRPRLKESGFTRPGKLHRRTRQKRPNQSSKPFIRKSLKLGSAGVCLTAALPANGAKAQTYFGEAGEIDFADSSGVAWTGHLNLEDWTGLGGSNGGTQLDFGGYSGGLTPAQLADIKFDGNAGTLGEAGLDSNAMSFWCPNLRRPPSACWADSS